MTTVVDYIQAIRQEALKKDIDISDELSRARQAMVATHAARVADDAEGMVKRLNEQLTKIHFKGVRVVRVQSAVLLRLSGIPMAIGSAANFKCG